MIGWRSKTPTTEAPKPKGFDDYDLRLGDLMRGERATLGKSLLDIQRDLKIKATYIAAIENADVGAFETPGFIAGFVRSYARYLGMDPDWAFAKFCREADFTPAHGMSAAASSASLTAARSARRGFDEGELFANPNAAFIPKSESLMARIEPGAIGSVSVLVAILAVIGYGGWAVLQEVQRVDLAPIDEAPVIVAQIDPLVPQGAAAPGATADEAQGAVTAEALTRLYEPKALDVPVLMLRDGPIAAIDPEQAGNLAAPGQVAPEVEEQATVLASADDTVEILAVRPSWIQVSAADGTVIFEKILDAGERYAVPALEVAPLLRAGNSGSVYFVLNGQTYGPASPGANVVKNLSLAAKDVTGAFALADMTRDPELGKFAAMQPAP